MAVCSCAIGGRLTLVPGVFRTGPGSKLSAAARGLDVAFEVDDVDETWEEGRSVLVRGKAVEVVDPDEVTYLRQVPLRASAGGDKLHFIKIVPSEISAAGSSGFGARDRPPDVPP